MKFNDFFTISVNQITIERISRINMLNYEPEKV